MTRASRSILAVLSAALLLLTAAPAGGFVTVVDNGPSANRVDMVFLGDGYTAADLAADAYAAHLDSFLQYMFSDTLNSDPFYRYRNFFNVHRIDVVSNESGADKPPEGIYVDTALDAKYYTGGTERLLTINSSKANAIKNAELTGAGFTAEMQFVSVNDTKYGGSGGSYAVYAGGNESAFELAMHEMGHSFAGLADEYDYDHDGPYTGSEPWQVNVTKDPTGQKWARWLGYDQPGIGIIGAYEGAIYHETGAYRPSDNSKMRSLNRPFDAVGREKIILDIYDLVDPLDAWRDNSLPLTDPGDLYVERIDDSVIDVEWCVDGAPVAGAGGETFNLLDFGYGQGIYEVTARAFDPTAFDPVDGWVRMNASDLEQTVAWDVTITVPEPAATPLLLLGGLAVLRRRRQAKTPISLPKRRTSCPAC